MRRGRQAALFLFISILTLYLYLHVMFLDNEQDQQNLTEDPSEGFVNVAPARSVRFLGAPPGATMETMLERRREARERCAEAEVLKPSEGTQQPNSKEFLVSEPYRLVWCNVFKAASSTWLDNFLRMAGYTDMIIRNRISSPVELARKIYPRPTVEQLQTYLNHLNYTSFIIVRDPFLRLLSAYRDKLESREQFYYRKLRCLVQGINSQKESPLDCHPTFREFVNYVIEEDAKGVPPDEHWAPYYSFCSPCQVDFEYILHFESLSRDEALLIENVPGLAEVVKPQTLHSSRTNYTRVTSEYFSQLTPRQLDGLLKIYLKDFRIFGYNETKYFDYIHS